MAQQLGAIGNHPLGQGKAQQEILKIHRRGHHHRLRNPVKNQRHRHFLGQHRPGPAGQRDRDRTGGQAHSAASIRRAAAACAA